MPSLGLPWPLPALGAWGCAWLGFAVFRHLEWPAWLAAAGALMLPAALAWRTPGWMKRLLILAGFPLSLLLSGQAQDVPPWAWLAPALVILLLYPVRAWRDAPFYPTDAGALQGLAQHLALPARPRLLDAGCGLGHGLVALRQQWPHAHIEGIEHSRVMAAVTRWRCPWARVQGGDMWQRPWGPLDAVYLFQRPETMPKAWAKACREMKPGRWLISLEFEIAGEPPALRWQQPGCRPVWIYRVPALPHRSTAVSADR
ncbi:MAG: class I SAM-dependent methyltransferase [Rubrivivax sp.]|nr:class I SAM-dependent methyltransferase [Rubrivivax sp.]